MLVKCTGLWGAKTIIDSDPVQTTARDVIYLPVNPSVFLDQYPGWGLYDRFGVLVPEAAYYRLPEHHLIGQAAICSDMPSATEAPPGNYLYGGPVILHYGHFVTTALARLWPLVRGGLAEGTKIVVHSQQSPEEWFTRDYVRSILMALHLTVNDFLVLKTPTRFARIVVPRPAFEEQNFVHRVFGSLCARVSRGILGPDDQYSATAPLYLSKARHRFGTARLLNEDRLQQVFADNGIDISYPETMSFHDQVSAMSRASVIIGTIGSGFHTSMFCHAPRRIVGLAYGPVVNANYALIDELVGNQSAYLYTHNIDETVDGESTFAYQARDPEAVGQSLLSFVKGTH